MYIIKCFNINIVECKSTINFSLFSVFNSFNINIVECKCSSHFMGKSKGKVLI